MARARSPNVSAPLPGGPGELAHPAPGNSIEPGGAVQLGDAGGKAGFRWTDAEQAAGGVEPPALLDFADGVPQGGGTLGVGWRQWCPLGKTGRHDTKQKTNIGANSPRSGERIVAVPHGLRRLVD